MRQAIIKEVKELTNKEVELLLENDNIQDEIMNDVMESESLYIDEMLNYIKPYLSDYSIMAYSYSYMNVSDIAGFINGVNKLNDDFNIFHASDIPMLYNAIESADLYCNLEIGSDEYIDAMYDVNSYAKVISNYLISEFVDVLEYYGSFDKVYVESGYVDVYLENIHDNECLINNGKVTLI